MICQISESCDAHICACLLTVSVAYRSPEVVEVELLRSLLLGDLEGVCEWRNDEVTIAPTFTSCPVQRLVDGYNSCPGPTYGDR